jgi:hypothetical protein
LALVNITKEALSRFTWPDRASLFVTLHSSPLRSAETE